MHYRKIGQTDLDVSVVGLGTWQFGGEWGIDFTQHQVDAILDHATEEGINLIDTAECYGDHLSEKLLGNYLSRHSRNDWIVATKFGHHYHGPFNRTRQLDPDDVLKQLDRSLKALQTDYIDLYQSHSLSDQEFNNDTLWTMLDKQKQAGKIRYIGLSLQNKPSLMQTKVAKELGVSALQLVYNRLTREAEQEIFPLSEENQLGILARVPLASGYLSGKYNEGDRFQSNDVRSRHDRDEQRRKLALVKEIAQSEVPEGMSMATWALAWCLQHPAVTTVIPGCKSVDQVKKNASAARQAGVCENHPQFIKST
ncbi:Predicted oxidoreductase [Amphibacillus marinus]|uniref:Predicted oxidoreductase n=1 Tax=Amphibacillus marinus TaxID=872970 RepID=A0A1H8QWM0_9BACI|nr:aldo/keto reductase [Amphibacillus marinus]SEO58602.1 Predicted oxidoreductase [Amphibacillus marinus]